MNEKERELYETGGIKKKNEKRLVTTITSENNIEYYLYDDGKIYQKDSNGELVQLKNVNEESRNLINKIMDKFRAGRIDIKIDINEKFFKDELEL